MRALLVEDDAVLAEFVGGGLREAGFVVDHEADGAAGLSAALTRQYDVAVIPGFAPLPRTMNPAVPTTGFDDVKRVALARLFLEDVASIQVDWSLYGPKLAQVALTVGANDVDAVSPLDDNAEGRRRAPLEEIRRNIRAAGLDPDNLPVSDKSKMSFGAGSAKAWRDIWGAGQGVGLMDDVPTVAEMVERLAQQYQAARKRLGLK